MEDAMATELDAYPTIRAALSEANIRGLPELGKVHVTIGELRGLLAQLLLLKSRVRTIHQNVDSDPNKLTREQLVFKLATIQALTVVNPE
jgi:hypothetical protein